MRNYRLVLTSELFAERIIDRNEHKEIFPPRYFFNGKYHTDIPPEIAKTVIMFILRHYNQYIKEYNYKFESQPTNFKTVKWLAEFTGIHPKKVVRLFNGYAKFFNENIKYLFPFFYNQKNYYFILKDGKKIEPKSVGGEGIKRIRYEALNKNLGTKLKAIKLAYPYVISVLEKLNLGDLNEVYLSGSVKNPRKLFVAVPYQEKLYFVSDIDLLINFKELERNEMKEKFSIKEEFTKKLWRNEGIYIGIIFKKRVPPHFDKQIPLYTARNGKEIKELSWITWKIKEIHKKEFVKLEPETNYLRKYLIQNLKTKIKSLIYF